MLCKRTQPFFSLLALYGVLIIDITPVSAQCDENGPPYSSTNATGTFQIPGWSSNGDGFTNTDPMSSWNITKSVVRDIDTLLTTSNTFLARPVDNTTSANYTYHSCIEFSTFPSGGETGYSNEDGTCASVATSECRQQLRDHLNVKATEFLSRDSLPKPALFCGEFWGTTPSSEYPTSCQNYTEAVLGQAPLGLIPLPDDKNNTCPALIASINGDTNSFSYGYNEGNLIGAAPDNADNFTAYDNAVRSVQNIIIVRFGIPEGQEGEAKADTQLVCPRASMVEQGSRIPPESLAVRNVMCSSLAIAVFVTVLAFVM